MAITKRLSTRPSGSATQRVPDDVIGLGPFLLLEGDFGGALAYEGEADGIHLLLEGDWADSEETGGTTKRISGAITQRITRRMPKDVIEIGPFLLLTGDHEGALRLTDEFSGYLKLTGEY
ncbi:hypothetical protein LJR235_002380 [Pararhizobium sp. LjRoot235]|uniref:hypothetical protein n=1 Tax=Pararhizobium sp. LjRoot235 TaxID=3342291 RepID=UPI003ECC75A5